ncbi:MAG TPA: UvrB/UvrC motif-containing protein, partial [Opitutaceae bacterium]
DKEGFLRSETSLIQTSGRAARHEKGRVILYADNITGSIARTVEITNARRAKQVAYNQEHGITPKSVKRGAQASLHAPESRVEASEMGEPVADEDVAAVLSELEEEMRDAADRLEFEKAALIRDQIDALRSGKVKRMARPANRRSRPTRAGSASRA